MTMKYVFIYKSKNSCWSLQHLWYNLEITMNSGTLDKI